MKPLAPLTVVLLLTSIPLVQFHEWAQKYGEIFYLRLGPQNVIVLNTAEAADELLTNRSRDYSGRASPHVASELMSAGQRMVFMSYDKEWRVGSSTYPKWTALKGML